MKKTLEELQALVVQFRDDRDWEQFHNLKDMFISLQLESSELLELSQWKNQEEILAGFQQTPESYTDEMADILYWLLLISKTLKIDLAQALEQKLEKNSQKYPISKARGSKEKWDKLTDK